MGRKDGYYGPSDHDASIGALVVIAAALGFVAVIGYCVGAELYLAIGGWL